MESEGARELPSAAISDTSDGRGGALAQHAWGHYPRCLLEGSRAQLAASYDPWRPKSRNKRFGGIT